MRCRICNNDSDRNKVFDVDEIKQGTYDRFQYFQCTYCGCIQIAAFPSNIATYYAQEHDIVIERKSASWRERISGLMNVQRPLLYIYVTLRVHFFNNVFFRLFPYQPIRVLLNTSKRASILDVGCNSGLLLYGLKRAGFQHLIGVDPFIKCDAMQYSNGVSVFKKPVEELSGAEVFDVIMFHHSFEHIPDQLKTLEAVYKLLKRNGTCFLRIPVLSSYMMQHYGTQWVHWDAPRHYFLHSLKSIAVLADKAGFRVEQIVHETNFTSLLWSELYKQKLSLGATFKYLLNPLNYAKVYGFIRQANKLNRAQDADCVAVYLRK